MDNSSARMIIKNIYIWWAGFLSLFLVEAGVKLTISSFSLPQVLILTLLVYSVAGIIFGCLFGLVIILTQRVIPNPKLRFSYLHASMAACMAFIIIIVVFLYFFMKKMPQISSILIMKAGILFCLSIATFFILLFFFRWMDHKGKLIISYLSLPPSLWIITTLTLIRDKNIFPPMLQITTISRLIFLTLCTCLCFFLLYMLIALGGRFINRWKGIPGLIPGLITIPVIVLLLVFFLALRKEDYRNNRGETKNAPIGKPNIVLITLDTVRADHIACYGYKRLTTPNLDSLSREGVLYKNAYATSPWTLPSHASIFTGMYPTKHGAHFNSDFIPKDSNTQKKESLVDLNKASTFKLSEEYITLAEILSERGYRTAGIIGGPFCASAFGLAQGFEYYNETFYNVENDTDFYLIYRTIERFVSLKDLVIQYGYSSIKRSASHLNKATIEWLEESYKQPFFLFINYFDAHNPYLPPPPYDEYFEKIPKNIILQYNPELNLSYSDALYHLINEVVFNRHQLTPKEKELLLSLYDGEICYLDYCLGLLFERLKSLKVYDNTLIIVASDHGEAFGEHDQLAHGRNLYEELIRIPLIIKYPSTHPQQGVIEKQVSLVDIFPTILDFLDLPIPSGIDGEILAHSNHPIIAEWHMQWADTWFESDKYRRDLKSIHQGKEKYIWASNSLNEYYDLEKDPEEKENLIKNFPQRAETMQDSLNRWLRSFKPQKPKDRNIKIDKSTNEKLRALGYVK